MKGMKEKRSNKDIWITIICMTIVGMIIGIAIGRML
jgi:hypothetical protein